MLPGCPACLPEETRVKRDRRCPPHRRTAGLRAAAGLLVLAAALVSPLAAGRNGEEKPEEPKSGADLVAGRWLVALEDLPDEHAPILASLAVEGDLLIGTLTVGRTTVPIHSGRIVGSQFRFSFRHVTGETFFMKGAPGPRGLEGSWHGESSEGRWTARSLKG